MTLQERIVFWQIRVCKGGFEDCDDVLLEIKNIKATEDDALLISFLLWAAEHAHACNGDFNRLADEMESRRWNRYTAAMAKLEVSHA